MKFAQRVFLIAGIYGIVVVAPLYFLEGFYGAQNPPAINHPEFYYGMVGIGLAWQVAFVIMSRDPVRYRPLMIPSVMEKFSYAGAMFVLLAMHRVSATSAATGLIDFALGVLFIWAYVLTGKEAGPRT